MEISLERCEENITNNEKYRCKFEAKAKDPAEINYIFLSQGSALSGRNSSVSIQTGRFVKLDQRNCQ